MITPDWQAIFTHLAGALLAGGVIGLERTFHGRPAGFRTHALVCLASSLLMLITLYQSAWLTEASTNSFRSDPTRMAQGIMTGIGFLGAGVIFKEGFTVRGLTTAASIWITAAIGILIGIGFYSPAVLATVLTLITLAFFRWIEEHLPTHCYAHHSVRFERHAVMPEHELRVFLGEHGFSILNISHRLTGDGLFFEYRMTLRTSNPQRLSELAQTLRLEKRVCAFRITPDEN